MLTSKHELHKKTFPKITIITPSYNQASFIERTINSVLSQNYPNLEYIIIDGGSTDHSVSIIKKYESKISYWISEKDRGQSHAINKGLARATGEIIGWLNSDDIYYPGALHIIADFFQKQASSQIVYGKAYHIDTDDNQIEEYPTEPWSYERLKIICYICQPAVFFRNSVFDLVGTLDESLQYCMDYEFWLRAGQHINTFDFIPVHLAGSRLYATNKTLGAKLHVHEEIVKMMSQKFGKVPSKWLFAHAHILAESQGFDLTNFTERRIFLFKSLYQWHRNRWHYNKQINIKEIIEDFIIATTSNRDAYQNRFDKYHNSV